MGNEEQIWTRLLEGIGNKYGVAGLMGNLYAESGLNPTNLENAYESILGYTDESYTKAVSNGTYSKESFINDSAGYGLAQWTFSSRKELLYTRFVNGPYDSIGNLMLQLNYLLYELEFEYPSVFDVLKNATSVRQASDKVLHDFENPKDQSESVEIYRASLGTNYYNKYVNGSGGGDTPGGDTPGSSNKDKRKFNFILFNRRRGIYG